MRSDIRTFGKTHSSGTSTRANTFHVTGETLLFGRRRVSPGWFCKRKQADKILKAFAWLKGFWRGNIALFGLVLSGELLEFAPIDP
jgi:hypothetical protein